jgi:hypothetical protein
MEVDDMRHWYLGALLLIAGCNSAGYRAVTIRPTYGWVDGCASVKISGHGFGTDISATVGGNAVTDITRPDNPDDQTFFFFANTPAAADAGAQDVVVTSDGKDSTIPMAYYYVACPATPQLDSVSPDSGIASGDTISLGGCNIDATGMRVMLVDKAGVNAGATVSLTSDCGTAFASFTAPAVDDGTYYVEVIDSDDNVINPATGDYSDCVSQHPLDSSGAACDAPLEITYGGAR